MQFQNHFRLLLPDEGSSRHRKEDVEAHETRLLDVLQKQCGSAEEVYSVLLNHVLFFLLVSPFFGAYFRNITCSYDMLHERWQGVPVYAIVLLSTGSYFSKESIGCIYLLNTPDNLFMLVISLQHFLWHFSEGLVTFVGTSPGDLSFKFQVNDIYRVT